MIGRELEDAAYWELEEEVIGKELEEAAYWELDEAADLELEELDNWEELLLLI